MHRLAVVFVPSLLTVVAATGWLVGQRRHGKEYVVMPPIVVAPRVAPAEVKATPPPPGRYDRPIGGQYLDGFETVLSADRDMPVLFALTQDDLRTHRFSWEPEAIATAMSRELGAVLDEACPRGCEEARDAIVALEDGGEFAPAVVRRKAKTEDVGEVRTISIVSRGEPTLEVACVLDSDYLGMRMWNDSVTCNAVIRSGKRMIATYTPRRQYQMSERIPMMVMLDAYTQRAKLGDGRVFTIETGRENPQRGVTTSGEDR